MRTNRYSVAHESISLECYPSIGMILFRLAFESSYQPWLERLSEDILISHCAPVPLRTSTDGEERIVDYPGNLVLWRWLGLGRFFPPQFETTFRGPASVSTMISVKWNTDRVHRQDYQESGKFSPQEVSSS